MLLHNILYYVIYCYIRLCSTAFYYIILYHISYHIMLYYTISFHVLLCCILSFCIVTYHVILHTYIVLSTQLMHLSIECDVYINILTWIGIWNDIDRWVWKFASRLMVFHGFNKEINVPSFCQSLRLLKFAK